MNQSALDNKEKFCIKKWFKAFDIPKTYAFITLPIFLMFYIIMIFNFVEYAQSDASKIFFGIIDRFTNQSNFLLTVYVFFFVFLSKHAFLKNNSFLIACMTYITFTFVGYNLILMPMGTHGYTDNVFDNFSNAWLHIVAPIVFIILGFLTFVYRANQQPKCIWKSMLYSMIYPTIYCLYLITIPFIYTTYKNGLETYSIYGKATNTKDFPLSWLIVALMYFIFFPGMFFVYGYSWYGISKKINKNKH